MAGESNARVTPFPGSEGSLIWLPSISGYAKASLGAATVIAELEVPWDFYIRIVRLNLSLGEEAGYPDDVELKTKDSTALSIVAQQSPGADILGGTAQTVVAANINTMIKQGNVIQSILDTAASEAAFVSWLIGVEPASASGTPAHLTD